MCYVMEHISKLAETTTPIMDRIGFKTIDPQYFFFNENFKKELLYFDKLLFDKESYDFWIGYCDIFYQKTDDIIYKKSLEEINLLIEKGFLIIQDFSKFRIEGNNKFLSFEKLIEHIDAQKFEVQTDRVKRVVTTLADLNVINEIVARNQCTILHDYNVQNVHPIFSRRNRAFNQSYLKSEIFSNNIIQVKNNNVINLLMQRIPLIDDNVGWEKIFELKQDDELKHYRNSLSQWIKEISTKDLSPNEIVEKYDFIIHNYNKQLDLHKMKYNSGNLEVIITNGLEIIENLVKFQWSSLAKNLFDIRKRKFELLQKEMSTPGTEISYFSKLNDRL